MGRAPDTVAANCRSCAAAAASVAPETTHGTTGTRPASSSAGCCAGSPAGSSASCSSDGSVAATASRITCAFVPLTPNDETAARCGRPSPGHRTGSVSSDTAPADQSTRGDGASMCRLRGSVR
jgi:hypothetical protein